MSAFVYNHSNDEGTPSNASCAGMTPSPAVDETSVSSRVNKHTGPLRFHSGTSVWLSPPLPLTSSASEESWESRRPTSGSTHE